MKARGLAPSAKASEAKSFLASAAEAAGETSLETPVDRSSFGPDNRDRHDHEPAQSSRSPVPAYEEGPAMDEASGDYAQPAEEEGAASPKPKKGRGKMRPANEVGERGKGVSTFAGSPAQKEQLLRALKFGLLAALPTVVVLAMVGWLAMTFGKLAPTTSVNPDKTIATVKQRKFSTADGGKVIVTGSNQDPGEASMTFAGNSEPLVMPLLNVGPDLKDFISTCASCTSHKDVWLEKTAAGLRDEEGTLYYSADAPEFSVVKAMRRVGDTAIRCYLAGTGYPKDKNYMVAFPYNVPGRGSNILPVLTVNHLPTNDGRAALVDPQLGEESLFNSLQKPESAMWLLEPAPEPGAVHCMNASYTFTDPPRSEFYVHGFDRDGHLIKGSDPTRVLLFASRNGEDLNPLSRYRLPQSKTRLIRLCIVTLPPGVNLHAMHALLPCLVIAIAFLVFMAGQLNKPVGALGFKLGSLDILSTILMILGISWGYFLLFAP
jgi:hypothetical protein